MQDSSDLIRKVQMEIMDVIHDFCEKNDIDYFLTGGSLIGALRHNGYIPWDDDIDIMMFRDDYDRFIELFNKSNSRYHAYSLKDEGYNYHFSKISDDQTQLDETNISAHDLKLGICVDLFPLDKYPEYADDTPILRKLHNLDKKMYGKSFRMENLRTRSFKQQMLICAYKLWGLFETKHSLGEKQEAIARAFANEETDRYSVITCHLKKNFSKISRQATVAIDHIFEDRIYKIPSTYDEYLTQQFGDYMTPPPEMEQKSHHSFTLKEKEN